MGQGRREKATVKAGYGFASSALRASIFVSEFGHGSCAAGEDGVRVIRPLAAEGLRFEDSVVAL